MGLYVRGLKSLAMCLVVLAAAAAAGPANAAATAATDYRFYDAAVNLPPDEPSGGGFAGAVRFHSVVGGVTSVDVWLSRSETVICGDGAEDVSSVTVRTVSDEATEPGPVQLDIDRRLREAQGFAAVDLLLTESPGCGAPDVTTTLPAQEVSIDVTGTSARFFNGIGRTATAGSDQARDLSYRLSRDGTGSLSVGEYVDAASSTAAFLVYGVDRVREHGTAPSVPASAAPPGGVAADGFSAAELEPPGGLGLVYEDAWVTAATTAPPERATTIIASALRLTRVECPDGGVATVGEYRDGAGPGTLVVGNKLADAAAAGTITVDRWTFGGCEEAGEPAQGSETVDAALDLTATGPLVRVQHVFWQLVPGEGARTRTNGWFTARDASGEVSVGSVSGATGLASISRAGPD